ncbi:hypothetical protein BGZ99_007928 [Dissophora globulifera]|uniref:Uncharacterized protein n=1 Tax=Dissophora globulifera TaxID=979702 RepID=A0A9P6RAR4_9FUNG|nr:hypothetical protein BGZ99_007928 [Dissophora globulifera]
MQLQVNFSTHGYDLKAAYEAIIRPSDPKNGDNWAIFGYDKGTNDLKVLGQGNGGLEELQEEFVDSKIQYAFTRVVDQYSQLNKFVLIGWCGDGVPESKKGLFALHFADVANFLKGYHLQLSARSEADVTPAQIMKRLQEGSGSKYSTHQENYQHERIQPLQSAYKKTEIPDIAALQRNPTKPEAAPKYNVGTKPFGASSSPAPVVPTKIQDRVWPPPATPSSPSSSGVASPTASSPAPTTERSWKTSGGGSSYSAGATTTSFNKVQPPSSLSSFGGSSDKPEPVVNKAHQIRLEREAREKEERERIKREIAASEARSQPSGVTSTAQRLAEERRLQEEKEREREQERGQQTQQVTPNAGFNRVREERLAREKEERERAEAEDAARSAREAFKAREQSGALEQAAAREEELRRQKEQEKRDQENKEAEARRAQEDAHKKRQQEEEARRRHEEEEEERRLNQHQQEEDDRQRQFEHEQEERRRQEEAEEQERRLQEEVSAATAQSVALGADAILSSADHPELATSGSVSAIVLYSYEKGEENEMALFEGEIIRNVTELDVGWWSGESEDGTRSGLFPANYVEVIEGHGEAATPSAEPAAAAAYEEEQHYQELEQEPTHDDYAHEQEAAAPAAAAAEAGEHKPSAVALYDYQAGEPNEISFAEGEAITEIDVK